MMFDSMAVLDRLGALTLVLVAALFLATTAALAQSGSCAQLNASLQSLSNNSDFRNADQSNMDLRAMQANERNAESAYIRTGCQRDQQAGYPQTPQCRGIARQILSQRAQLAQLSQSIANAGQIAQQREQVLQEIARFGCNQGQSQGRFLSTTNPPRRRNFLDQLFGGFQGQDAYGNSSQDFNGQDQVEDPYANQQIGNTIRTVCVRLVDGYFWPISFSTTRDYLPDDAATCQSECPAQQVELYYYDNPGQESDQMVNQEGQPYTALPSAFAYRKKWDRTLVCNPPEPTGKLTVAAESDGRDRAIVTYGDARFPLPLRDPRRPAAPATLPAVAVASIAVPLPRPRPTSTSPDAAPPPDSGPVVSAQSRIVKVAGKTVRVVGPDTPYAPATASGS